MKKLAAVILSNKHVVLETMEASFERDDTYTIELEPDYDFTSYDGLSDKEYPLWQSIELNESFLFIHDASLIDYGYYLEGEMDEDDFPRYTSGSHGSAEAGILKLKLESIDRFGCRLFIRGHLHGSSAELSLDVRLKLCLRGYARSGHLGYVGEAVAEGYTFGKENRLKQEFFQYFAALDSYINIHANKYNSQAVAGTEIPENDRLIDKLSKTAKYRLQSAGLTLNQVPFWSDFKAIFKRLVEVRNNVAHNIPPTEITRAEVDECFCILSVALAVLEGSAGTEDAVSEYLGIS